MTAYQRITSIGTPRADGLLPLALACGCTVFARPREGVTVEDYRREHRVRLHPRCGRRVVEPDVPAPGRRGGRESGEPVRPHRPRSAQAVEIRDPRLTSS